MNLQTLPMVLQALYAHEINCGVASFGDDGWKAWIGDRDAGCVAESAFDRDQFHTIPGWLIQAAHRHYPHAASTH